MDYYRLYSRPRKFPAPPGQRGTELQSPPNSRSTTATCLRIGLRPAADTRCCDRAGVEAGVTHQSCRLRQCPYRLRWCLPRCTVRAAAQAQASRQACAGNEAPLAASRDTMAAVPSQGRTSPTRPCLALAWSSSTVASDGRGRPPLDPRHRR